MLKNLPNWEGSETELRRISFLEAEKIYGKVLPRQVERRILEEIEDVVKQGYEGVFLINYEMVKNSSIDKYDCYYRGYAGYSFVAFL